jgi:Ca2+/Na+ antiporter
VTPLECERDWNQLIARTVICVVDVGFTVLGTMEINLLFLIVFLFVFSSFPQLPVIFFVEYSVMSFVSCIVMSLWYKSRDRKLVIQIKAE